MAGIGGRPASPKPLTIPELLGRREGRLLWRVGGGWRGEREEAPAKGGSCAEKGDQPIPGLARRKEVGLDE